MMSILLPQLFDQLNLPRELIEPALEYARLSMTAQLSEQQSDRIEEILKLTEQHAGLDLVLNQIDEWCLYTANPAQSLVLNEDRIDELVWLYALLSSQPTLSEHGAYQMSQILDLATCNEPLALLLNEIDRFILESSEFMSDEAQHDYANQASRILEFVAPNLDSESSEQLLTVLSHQCADLAPNVLTELSSELSDEATDLTPQAKPSSRCWIKPSPKGCFISAIIGVTAFVGLAISCTNLGQTPLPATEKSLSVKPSATGDVLLSNSSKSEPSRTILVANRVQQHFENEQSRFETEQSNFEREQSTLEGKQQQAEYHQLLAESQHQYQEAQQWHQKARQYLEQSQQMKAKAQGELRLAQSSLERSLSTPEASRIIPNSSQTEPQPNRDRGLLQTLMPPLFGSSLLTVISLLLWSGVDARKRQFG